MKKKIGIYGASMGENAWGVGKTYLDFVSQFGVPRILTPDNLFDPEIDMLLLQGGLDVPPSAYGEIPGYYTSNTDVFKQHVMEKCLPNYVEHAVPIFGICLGMQQLAVFFGSKMTQHIPYHPTSDPRHKDVHSVMVDLSTTQDFYLGIEREAKNKKKYIDATFRVNSLHHQCVVREDLNLDTLLPVAHAANEEYEVWDKNKEIIEVIRHRELPIAGVQFHPEERYTPFVTDLLNHMLGL